MSSKNLQMTPLKFSFIKSNLVLEPFGKEVPYVWELQNWYTARLFQIFDVWTHTLITLFPMHCFSYFFPVKFLWSLIDFASINFWSTMSYTVYLNRMSHMWRQPEVERSAFKLRQLCLPVFHRVKDLLSESGTWTSWTLGSLLETIVILLTSYGLQKYLSNL